MAESVRKVFEVMAPCWCCLELTVAWKLAARVVDLESDTLGWCRIQLAYQMLLLPSISLHLPQVAATCTCCH